MSHLLPRVEPSGSRDSGFEGSRFSNRNFDSFSSTYGPHQGRGAWKHAADLEEDGCIDTSTMTRFGLNSRHGIHPGGETTTKLCDQQLCCPQTLHDSGFKDSSGTSYNELGDSLYHSCKIKQYVTLEKRLNSFKSFPLISEIPQHAFAEAGLYFTGQNDKVKCAWCLGKLYNWLKGDIPMLEHSRHFRECPYVLAMKNNEKEKPLNVIKEDSACSFTGQNVISNSSPCNVDNSKVIEIVKRLGYDMGLIEKAISVLTDKGVIDFKTAEILEELFKLEKDEAGESDSESVLDGACGGSDEPPVNVISRRDPQLANGLLQPEYAIADLPSDEVKHSKNILGLASQNDIRKISRSAYQSNQTNQLNPLSTSSNKGLINQQMKSALKIDGDHTLVNELEKLPEKKTTIDNVKKVNMNNPELIKLAEERSKLRKNVICNVCNDTKIDVLFLPCRHMVACENCSSEMNNCLKCSKTIVATVKIFML